MSDLKLDHVGVGVKDLERGRSAYERLGFRLTARSMHAGSPAAGAPVVPWGSGNHCAMFREGYLEVVGLTDPNRYSSVKEMVARYEGLHIIALGCDDADATYAALNAAGIPAEPPRALERDAAFGVADEEIRRARFRNIYLDRERYPEGRFLYIEHLTRDVLWQPHLLDHPNGALALEAVYFCAPDAHETAAKIGAAVRAQPQSRARGHVVLPLARGTLHVYDTVTWSAVSGHETRVAPPTPVGFGVRVASLHATRELLAQSGKNRGQTPISRNDRDQNPTNGAGNRGLTPILSGAFDGIWVGPDDGCGAVVHFFEES